VAEECEREHASLRLDDGNLFRCIFFEMDAGSNRVFLLGHHVVLDNLSWGVILDDLATLVIQTFAGTPLRLPEKTASARAWAVALADRAGSTAVSDSVAHWTAMPAETLEGIAGCNRDAELLTVTLGVEASQLLLHEAPKRLDATAQALLLGSLLLAWREWTGHHALRVDLEGHGRDILSDALDVSRTVGWFTTVFPIYLSLPRGVDDGDAPPVESVVQAVGKALDALPMRGAAHGLARYVAPDESVRAALAAQPRPAVLFNYVGSHDVTLPVASQLRVMVEPQGRARDLDAPRPYSLEINARVEDGALIVTKDLGEPAALWTADGRRIRTFDDQPSALSSGAFSRNGRLLLTASDLPAVGPRRNALVLRDASNGVAVARLPGHRDHPRAVAFSPDSRLALSGDRGGAVYLWTLNV